MDPVFVTAKRCRDKASSESEVEKSQLKFARLLETSRAAREGVCYATQEEVRKATLEFLDDQQSFDGILEESDGGKTRQGCSSLEFISSLSVEECIVLLKNQALKVKCPLDQLAAEQLAEKLISISTGLPEHKQVLKESQLTPVSCILNVIKHLLSEQGFNRVYFTKHLTNKGHCLPLEVVWMLHSNCIVSFSTYLAYCLQHEVSLKIFTDDLTALSSAVFINKENQENILSDILGGLVIVSFQEKAKEGSNKLEEVAQEILDVVVDRIDFLTGKKIHGSPGKEADSDRLCVLEVVRKLNNIPQTALRRFFTRQLNQLFIAPSEIETSPVYHAVCKQREWKFSSLTQTRRTVFEQFLLIFDLQTVMEFIKQALFKEKVNWENTLSFLSVFVVLVKEAVSLIEGYVNVLVGDSLNSNDTYSLSVAFLMIRQASLEGGHVYHPYVTWFQSMFGDQGNPKLVNKRIVQFFMKFLSDLVPCEPAEYLKVHILKPPQVPAKLRVFVTDYTSLAKTRLMDLKEPLELMTIYGDSAATEGRSHSAKQHEHASADVEKVLETFEKTGKVPSSVMEASIFRKPYFIGRFLPALLVPRQIPKEQDARLQIIGLLNKAGKIPKKMLLTYQSACEKITNEQVEVSSPSDDEGSLSDIERLRKNLDRATTLVLESLKTPDTWRQTGRVSSQLSIISANIQSAFKTTGDLGLASQLAELNVENLGKVEAEPVTSVVLDAFCETYTVVKRSIVEAEYHADRHEWAANFVAMISSLTLMHKSIYQQLWRKLCCGNDPSLNMDQVCGFAAFLCHLCVHHSTLTPILLKGNRLIALQNIQGDLSICSYLEALCDSVPIHTNRWMDFYLRFSCSYLEHVIAVFNGVVTEVKSNVGDHTAYLPQVLLNKTFYLLHRLNFNGEPNLYRPTLPQDLVDLVSHVASQAVFKEWHDNLQKLTFSQWCRWELNISAKDDFLPETARRLYHQFRVLDHFLLLGSPEGGCDGNARDACSILFNTLLDCQSSFNRGVDVPGTDVSRSDIISLLQELIPMLSRPESTRDIEGGSRDPWLLEQLESRIKKAHSKVDDNQKNKGSSVSDLQKASEVAAFMKLAVRLPPFLLFADRQHGSPNISAINRVTAFINSSIRVYLSENCRLPFDIAVYILKAVLTYLTRSLHESRRNGNSSQLLSLLMTDCPLFFVSLQHYWKQLKPLILSYCDVTAQEPLQQAECISDWIKRVEAGQTSSIQELEYLDAGVVASCIAVTLQRPKSKLKIMTLFNTKTDTPSEFSSKVAVCLFDCIMSTFSAMILQGHEVTDSPLRDLALNLVKCFPITLSVFSRDINSSFEGYFYRLRSFVIKDQLIKLYPAVFFSLFSNSPSEALQEVMKHHDFLQVTLAMYNAFVSLRKDCLEGIGSKSAISSPLHLDFCRQVSNFVRNCVLSSPKEQLTGLSQDVISSCTAELQQFLHNQLTKLPQRRQYPPR